MVRRLQSRDKRSDAAGRRNGGRIPRCRHQGTCVSPCFPNARHQSVSHCLCVVVVAGQFSFERAVFEDGTKHGGPGRDERDDRCGRGIEKHGCAEGEVDRSRGRGLGDPQASVWRVLSARACSPSCATVDSTRKVVKARISECACSTGGTRPSRTTGPLPRSHPPHLRLLDISAQARHRNRAV
jgi:hypothetical protein